MMIRNQVRIQKKIMNDIESERIKILNNSQIETGQYVVYWMQQSQRIADNQALLLAVQRADYYQLPLIVYFVLTWFPEANLRHYRFMLENLILIRSKLRDRQIRMIIEVADPLVGVSKIAENAREVITDKGYLNIQKKWRQKISEILSCRIYEVETDVIVPVEQAYSKQAWSAGVFRPKILAKLPQYLKKIPDFYSPQNTSWPEVSDFPRDLDLNALLIKLQPDNTVQLIPSIISGEQAAEKLLENFIRTKISHYHIGKNDPGEDFCSGLSPYLHFGQISPLKIARRVLQDRKGDGSESFLEELIVRRELSCNFVHYQPLYDQYESLPEWARKTLGDHRLNQRPFLYSLEELENSQTHDQYWNAAQTEMVLTGKMHGYMRMYWGKKVIEWTENPEEAFEILQHLNNKYELDGRDANAYTGIAWCFGLHDRPWTSRAVFGTVRYMNDKGLERKFNMVAYLDRINKMRKDLT